MKIAPGLRFSLRRRRLAAVHEAGRAVIAASLGLRVQTWIWPTYRATEEIPIGREAWGGFTRHEETNEEATRLIGVAGAIAQAAWLHAHDRCGAHVGNWQQSMSDFDWKSIGCEAGKPDAAGLQAAKRVIAVLDPGGALWSRLCHMAARHHHREPNSDAGRRCARACREGLTATRHRPISCAARPT